MPDGSRTSDSQLALARLLPELVASADAPALAVDTLAARIEEALGADHLEALADALARRRPRALYAESQRLDWNTPEEGLAPVYETQGRVTLDPCSNDGSIVKADRAIVLPDGASELDPTAGGLGVSWEDEDVFANIPFGKKTIPLWMAKAILERHRARSTIFLVPAYVSTHWFDRVFDTAQAICLWGKPGKSASRLTFGGATSGAGFAVMYVLWTRDHDRLVRFTRAFSQVGQVIFPDACRAIARRMSARMTDNRPQDGDLLAYAEHKLLAARYDDLLTACADVQELTVGDLMDSDAEALKARIGSLPLREVLDGLSLRVGEELASFSAPDPPPPALPSAPPEASPGVRPHIARDEAILGSIAAAPDGLLKAEIEAQHKCTSSQLRGSLERLKKTKKIEGVGPRTDMRYKLTTASEQEQEPPT